MAGASAAHARPAAKPSKGGAPLNLHAMSRAPERTIARIPLKDIAPNPHQPRRTFPESGIADLAESIRQHGLLTPLLVRRVGAERYELIAGERRLRALRSLGRSHAEAIVLGAFDLDSALLALIENLQRENLHYLDEAEAYRAILDAHCITQEALARSLSLSASALANRLRLLRLSDRVRAALRETGLSERHARALLRLSDEEAQLELIQETVSHRLTVQQLEARIRRLLAPKPPRPHVSHILRDNRILVNAVLDTVRELNRIGVQADSRVEEQPGAVQVIVTIHTPQRENG